jgi:hypothetical protein
MDLAMQHYGTQRHSRAHRSKQRGSTLLLEGRQRHNRSGRREGVRLRAAAPQPPLPILPATAKRLPVGGEAHFWERKKQRKKTEKRQATDWIF